MSQKERMIKGLSYFPMDEELVSNRQKCKTLCFEYNSLSPLETDKKKEILDKIIKSHKDNFIIEPNFWCDYGYNIEIGENFYSNHNLILIDCAKITFGDNVFIGPNCGFYTAQHPLDIENRNKGIEYAFEIKVGSNVWFGGGVNVMPNVTIGSNCVIAGGSVVTKDIEDNVIVGGNPAKVIRKITPEDKYKFEKP